MVHRLLRIAGTVLIAALGLVIPIVATATSSPASADTVIGTCDVVSNPSPTQFTDCPGQDLSGASFDGLNLSYANLSGDTLVDCFADDPPTCAAADFTGANLTDADLSSIAPSNNVGTRCGAFPCGAAGYANFTSANLSGANLSDTALGGVTFTDANLTGVNLTNTEFDYSYTSIGETEVGAILTGANFTDTVLVPSNQSATATSQAGAVVNWTTPAAIAGATPGSCTPASGSTFPLFTTAVTCQVLDADNDVATGTFQVNVAPTTSYFSRVLVPSDGSTLSGTPYLDAEASDTPGVTKVVFELSGGSLSDDVIATATPSIYGWIAPWNTTTVANGNDTLVAVATDADGNTDASTAVGVTVDNPVPSTTVLVPAGGSSVSGASSVLDAAASPGDVSVTYELSGGSLSNQVIATGSPSLYGWLAEWNTTSVPNGTYSLVSVAAYPNGVSTTSAPVSISVDNTAPSTTVLVPKNGADVSGTSSVLDASAPSNVTAVTYELTGGSLADQVIATATLTYYGWLATWNTTSVADGTYSLTSVASYAGGLSGTSAPISITVDN
jgi:uncharacterized protein YjbI with pentapeptide repeats